MRHMFLMRCIALAPEHMFPTQLRQACAAVTHLVDSGTSPSDLFIGGDSVGASLGLALLSHILHPHPELLPLPLARPLAGAFAISPYSTDARGISMHSEDNLHPRSYVQYIAATSTKNSTAWGGTDALGPPSGWWTLLPTVTPRVLVTSGSAESLCGRQLQLVQRLQKEAPDAHVELVLEEGAVHTNPVCDLDAMGDGPGEAAKRIAEWLAGAQ
jgi:acetyl esterase/lipase